MKYHMTEMKGQTIRNVVTVEADSARDCLGFGPDADLPDTRHWPIRAIDLGAISDDPEDSTHSFCADLVCDPDGLTNEDKRNLGKVCTRDEDGRHFTEVWPSDWLDEMERRGFIEIVRPVCEATGIPYSSEYWGVVVAPETAGWFDDYGELIED